MNLICIIWVEPEAHPALSITLTELRVHWCMRSKVFMAVLRQQNKKANCTHPPRWHTCGVFCAVAMVSGSLQEGSCPAEERSIAPPGGEPAEGQHRRLRSDHPAAFLLPTGHQAGRWERTRWISAATRSLIAIAPKSKHTRPTLAHLYVRNGKEMAFYVHSMRWQQSVSPLESTKEAFLSSLFCDCIHAFG